MGWLHFIRDTNRCVPPHPLRYAQHLPPSGGRLLLLRIFIMLDQSYQLSHSAMPDSRAQLCPRGTLIADQRRACAARPRGKAGSERRKACFHPGGSGFHLPRGGGSAAFQFYQLGFYVARSLLWYFPCTPRATALRQARVSGGNLQNCAPSAACGGAMTQESTVLFVLFVPSSPRPYPGYSVRACSVSSRR